MHRLLRALLLAAAALAVAASPLSSRKLLQEVCTRSNPCKKAGVTDGCLIYKGDEYVCHNNRATQCLDGEVCDPATHSCVEEQPDGPCNGRPDGCYHFSHHDGMCTAGQQSLCPSNGRCNADGTACEQPEQPDEPCDGRPDGCYHFSHHDGLCTAGKQSLCPNSGRCNTDGTACETEEDPNAKCEGKQDGCYTGHKGDYLCKDGAATTCPAGTRCSSAALDATCV